MLTEGADPAGGTHEAMIGRLGALLRSMGVRQSPVHRGPAGARFQGLGTMARREAPAQPSTRQIWSGDSSFTVHQAAIGGNRKGWYVTAPAGCTIPTEYTGVFTAGNEYWIWDVGPSWPSGFTLIWQSGVPTDMPTSGWTRLTLQPLPAGGQNYIDSGLWKVVVAGTSTNYYMKRVSKDGVTDQVWYGPASQSTVYIDYGSHANVVFSSTFAIDGSYVKLITTENT
jgi:hypothetical protein